MKRQELILYRHDQGEADELGNRPVVYTEIGTDYMAKRGAMARDEATNIPRTIRRNVVKVLTRLPQDICEAADSFRIDGNLYSMNGDYADVKIGSRHSIMLGVYWQRWRGDFNVISSEDQ